MSAWLEEWNELIAQGNNAALEEHFLAQLEADVSRAKDFLEALAQLRRRSKKTLAASLLELAAVEAKARSAWTAYKAFLCEMLRLGVGEEAAIRADLEMAVRHLWAGRPSLEMLLAHFTLGTARDPADTLEELELWLAYDVGGVFAMPNRGAGRVVALNPSLGVLRLDFERESNVPVPIHAAAKYLTPLPAGHFLRQRLEDREALVQQAADDPPGVLEQILESSGAPMTVSEIKAALEGVVSGAAWTPWWNRAKKHPRLLASGSGSRVAYRLAAVGGIEEEVLREFEEADLAQQVELARRHGSCGKTVAARMAEVLLQRAWAAQGEPGLAWEAVTGAERLGAGSDLVAEARNRILATHGALAVLAGLADAAAREVVLEAERSRNESWIETFAAWLERETHPRVLSQLVAGLLAGGGEARCTAFFDQVLLIPQRFPAAYAWLCEVGENHPAFPLIDDRRGGSFLLRLVELAERHEMTAVRARLKEVLSPRGLAAVIVRDRLTLEQGRRLAQVCEKPGALAAERGWLRRAVLARFPELVEPAVRGEAVPALASTVARLQEELRRLLDKEIPETLKAIQIAREEGDLRENFEYHAQRARQELLSARAAKLQADLARVIIIDPAKVDPSAVRAGTTVRLRQVGGDKVRRITVLGPYEGDPEAGILSVGTEVVQALLGRGLGEKVVMEGGNWVIEGIERAVVQ